MLLTFEVNYELNRLYWFVSCSVELYILEANLYGLFDPRLGVILGEVYWLSINFSDYGFSFLYEFINEYFFNFRFFKSLDKANWMFGSGLASAGSSPTI